jgi:hypothetical protein
MGMAGSGGGIVVHLDAIRALRMTDFDGRAQSVTAAFVAAATAEIPRKTLARALILSGLQMLAEAEGLMNAGEYAREILSRLARDSAG